nr:hypothetical protein [uncultured Lacibacter sp.]
MNIKKNSATNILSILLIITGCLQIAGYITGSKALRGIGFSYGASPLPTVFGTVNGVEGFSTEHQLLYTNRKSEKDSVLLDQEIFSHFRGSYYLKNSYSIFLAYPHILKDEQVSGGMHFLLCKKNLLKQFNLPDTLDELQLKTIKKVYDIPEVKIFNPVCKVQ